MRKITTTSVIGIFIVLCGLLPGGSLGALKYGELRVGAHGGFINPMSSDFNQVAGYGGIVKYKFTDTLGIEAGVDYWRWEFDGDILMPYGEAPGPITYKEIDRVYPIYLTALIFSPVVEERARGYLGLGAGYYQIDADIDGSYNVVASGVTYPTTITGKITGQWSVHVAVGADFQLSDHIYLNLEARYVLTDIDREQTHSNPDRGAVTVKDSPDFNNWQVRAGLEYSF
jgi:opacity protein-like surface antigen